MIGGSCINIACIPTKAFIACARRLALCKEAKSFGINSENNHKKGAENPPPSFCQILALRARMRTVDTINKIVISMSNTSYVATLGGLVSY